MENHNGSDEQRHFIRHPMCFPLRYKVIKGEIARDARESDCTTLNVGRGGLLFSTRHPVGIDADVVLSMPLYDKLFKVKAKVVHCQKTAEDDQYRIGVCFQKMSDAFKVRLVEQMYLISEYRDVQRLKSGRKFSLQEASLEWIKRYSERFKKLYW